MFKEMRRKDRELQQDEVIEILLKGEYGVLSTIGENGYPYGIPVSYVFMDHAIYFHCALEGQKLDHIQNNKNVSFCVVGETTLLPDKFSTKYESVVIFGVAEEVLTEVKDEVLFAIIKKYAPQYQDKGETYLTHVKQKTKVIKINIEKMSGKARR